MKTRSFAAALAGALCLPLMAGPSAAQTNPCEDLLTLVTEAGDTIRPEFRDASRVAEVNDATQCTVIIAEVERLGGISDEARPSDGNTTSETASETESREFTASETVTTQVEVEQKAVVEGEVIVGLPDPEVTVDQPGAEVTVRESPASVTVDERSADIVVRQRQATISVEMPQPTITIEQPAPEIIITMPRAGVSLDRSAPRVEVVMADPQVSVSQADPTLDVEVDARFVDPDSEEARNTPDEGVVARTQRLNAHGTGDSEQDASVRISKGEAQIDVVKGEGEAQVSYNRAEPTVRYESADPAIEITSNGEPRIEIRRMGEPRVTFRDAEGQDEATDRSSTPREDQTRTVLNAEERERFLGRADTSGMSLQPAPVRVSDLIGKDVVTAGGDDVGEISRIVTNNNRVFAVITHGGFLGLGENETALPLRRIAIQDDKALLLGLTESELDEMPSYDPAQNRRMEEADQFEINMVDG